jgi:hypothetical protein
MARQQPPWYTPGQSAADDTWPLDDPYGEPGPALAGQQDQQPAVPAPGCRDDGLVPAAGRPRRRPALSTSLRPGRC